jgi:hypothetical protein
MDVEMTTRVSQLNIAESTGMNTQTELQQRVYLLSGEVAQIIHDFPVSSDVEQESLEAQLFQKLVRILYFIPG